MSEAFMLASALYYIAEAGGLPLATARAIERQIDEIQDPSEWFAACMYIEDMRHHQPRRFHWSAVR